VLANDTDVDTDADINKEVCHSRSFSVTATSIVGEAHGTVSETGGVVTFSPEAGYNGTQKISYTLSDGYGGTATGQLTVDVGSVNDAPNAADDSVEVQEDHTASINVLENDTDLDEGDTKTLIGLTGTSGLPGSISFEADGDVSFVPDANYYGEFTVGYTVQDSASATGTGTLTIKITPVNDAPTAAGDTVNIDEDDSATIQIGPLIDDVDLTGTDGDTLTVSVKTADMPEHGSLTVTGTQCVYTPSADWNGTDEFTYTVTDREGATATAVIAVTVAQVNDAPVAEDDLAVVNEDVSISIPVMINDSDSDTLESLNSHPEDEELSLVVTEEPEHGSAIVSGDMILYTPAANYNGSDSLTYELSDGDDSDTAEVLITVKQVNDNPTANNDTATTNDEEMVSINVLNNDTDVDTQSGLNAGVLHSISDFRVTGTGTPGHGKTAVKNNQVEYTPADGFAGTDSFVYMMSDGHGGTANATVTVTVLSVNDPPETPVVITPADGTRYGGGSTVSVTWTCFDIDGDPLTYTLEYFDGKVWTEAAKGLSETSYNFALPGSLGNVTDLKFRVKASDGLLTSDYGYSGKLIVDKDAPANIVVSMKKADGKAYTAGTWTNQDVTVKAVSVEDVSSVTFKYSLENKAYADGASKVVTSGVHEVYILATDALGNKSEFGGYLVKIDKLAPAVPDTSVSISGNKAQISFALLADPGGSGNSYIATPDGTQLKAADSGLNFTASENGAYAFTIVDNVGNSTKFSVTVDVLDATPPVIKCDSGSYKIGENSAAPITAVLNFSDDKSEITAKGYAVTQSETYSGVYKSYQEALSFAEPGTYYIHAFAQNSFGLTATEKFGPFIVAAAAEPSPEPTENPPEVIVTGDVVIKADQVAENVKQVRLPGGEWQDSLVLDGIAPGTYLVEVMDEDGNVTMMEITITDEDIAAGLFTPHHGISGVTIWILAALLIMLLLLLLLLWRNVTVQICALQDDGSEKVLRTVKRLKRRRDLLEISLKDKHVSDALYGRITLSKGLTRRMENKTLVVTVEGSPVYKDIVPESRNRFVGEIEGW
jgi:hypothetical protein